MTVIVTTGASQLGPQGATGPQGPIGPQGPPGADTATPFTKMEGFGHSYMTGTGATSNHGYFAKMSAMLTDVNGSAVSSTNFGVSGSALAGNTNSGYVTILQDLPRANGGGPYLQASSLAIIDFFINDPFFYSFTNLDIMFKSALRTSVSRIRAASTGVFEDTDASIAYGANWTQNAGNSAYGSGSTNHSTGTSGSNFTITVPSDFPGGTIAIGFIAANNSHNVWSVTVDGGAATTLDTTNLSPTLDASGSALGFVTNGAVMRLAGLTPGTHSIVVTANSISGTAYFDYWQVEANEPPLVLIIGQYRLRPGSGRSTTDSQIAQGNIWMQAVTAEFDSLVKFVPVDTLFNKQAALYYDGLHPSDSGHSMIAAALLRTVDAYGVWNLPLATSA